MSNLIIKLIENMMSHEHELPKGNLLQIRDEHHVHLRLGYHWKFSERVPTLGAGASLNYLIEVSDEDTEFTFVVYGSAESHVQLFEAPTYSAKGVLQAAYNHHRHAAKLPTLLIYKGPSLSTDGTSLLHLDAGSGASPGHAGAGGLSVEHDPWILREGAYYLLRFTNSSAGNIITNIQIDWYETHH